MDIPPRNLKELITIIMIIVVLGLAGYWNVNHQEEEEVIDGSLIESVAKQQATLEEVVDILLETQPEPITIGDCYITHNQLEVVQFSYAYGHPDDLGYTLAAISIKESNAGMWNINIQDPSAGFYHVTLDKVLNKMEWVDTGFNRNRAAQLLLDDRELSAELALTEIEYWRKQSRGNWIELWASYNAGHVGDSSNTGKEYAEQIRSLIRKIERCQWVESLTVI